MNIRIKDWNRFQHFKDRRPPWIKLYREILDDLDFHMLSGDDAKALIMLWLLASENDGYLPDIKVISFRLRISEKEAEKKLSNISRWLEHENGDDITMISKRYHDDTLEKRRDREETEREKKGFEVPDWIDREAWDGFEEMRKKIKKPMTDRARQLIVNSLLKSKEKGYDPNAMLDASTVGGWQKVYEPKDAPKNGHAKLDSDEHWRQFVRRWKETGAWPASILNGSEPPDHKFTQVPKSILQEFNL